MSCDALLIDFGGVLTTSVFDAFGDFCVATGLPRDMAASLFRSDPDSGALLVAVEKAAITEREFEERFAARLGSHAGVAIAADGLLAGMTAGLRPVPELIDATLRLRAQGVPTVLVSNALGEACYAMLDLDALFDHVVLSTRLGVRKPSRRIFLEAAALAGVEPARCLMVDDLEHNLAGAARVGMRGLLHRSTAETLAGLERELGLAPAA